MEGKVAAYGDEYYKVAAVTAVSTTNDPRSRRRRDERRPAKNAPLFVHILKDETDQLVEKNRLEGRPISYGPNGQLLTGQYLHKAYN